MAASSEPPIVRSRFTAFSPAVRGAWPKRASAAARAFSTGVRAACSEARRHTQSCSLDKWAHHSLYYMGLQGKPAPRRGASRRGSACRASSK
eukprot:scaffold41787_cov55-Phaeocystis_antarctica.AAC.3